MPDDDLLADDDLFGDTESSTDDDLAAETTSEPQFLSPEVIEKALDALTKAIANASSSDQVAAQQLVAQRIALSGAVAPSRVPVPRNITEVGGYINLLRESGQEKMLTRVLAGTLGVADELTASMARTRALPPALFFSKLALHRPEELGDVLANVPTHISVRSDFIGPLRTALDAFKASGAAAPIVSPSSALPPAFGHALPPTDRLPFIGRLLRLLPNAALGDPATDPVVIARPAADPAAAFAVHLRVLDPATTLPAQDWSALQRQPDETVGEVPVQLPLIAMGPELAQAGWIVRDVAVPADAVGSSPLWTRVENHTGLIEDETRFGDEMALVHPAHHIAASSLRTALEDVWDGTSFA